MTGDESDHEDLWDCEDDTEVCHPELIHEDIMALHEYARVPLGLRRSIGGWSEDAEERDKNLEWNRQQRKIGRREIEK